MKTLRRGILFLVAFICLYVISYWYLFDKGGLTTLEWALGQNAPSTIRDPHRPSPVAAAAVEVYAPLIHLENAWRLHTLRTPYVGTWESADGTTRVIVDSWGDCQAQFPGKAGATLYASGKLEWIVGFQVFSMEVKVSGQDFFIALGRDAKTPAHLSLEVVSISGGSGIQATLHRVSAP